MSYRWFAVIISLTFILKNKKKITTVIHVSGMLFTRDLFQKRIEGGWGVPQVSACHEYFNLSYRGIFVLVRTLKHRSPVPDKAADGLPFGNQCFPPMSYITWLCGDTRSLYMLPTGEGVGVGDVSPQFLCKVTKKKSCR